MQIVYDDQCAVCRNFKAWITHKSDRCNVEFIALSDPAIGFLKPETSRKLAAGTIVVFSQGSRLTGARAVLTVIGNTNSKLSPLARILSKKYLAMCLEPAYKLVARHRYMFSRLLKV